MIAVWWRTGNEATLAPLIAIDLLKKKQKEYHNYVLLPYFFNQTLWLLFFYTVHFSVATVISLMEYIM